MEEMLQCPELQDARGYSLLEGTSGKETQAYQP